MSDNTNIQGTWQTVSRSFGAGAARVAGAGALASPMDRWLAEPSGSSPYNTIGQVRQGHDASTNHPPAPSTNHATSGSAKE
ncbi:hypothetical protein GGTG_09248 [Gaeumannomyces tritici R3-111a-1]|uniref:Uncharacterized protein n=1 Tax=Gaeumannomyces tritici (strain R3-111a-1) TaxID=644352 RepID=J3P6V6_GAET3|nr:hypothetical protein GGTG_09248 [Gaeumannomyces tritici R3-111a-1]EJT72382.1 hypothetical protein GGTG_09248 [Gaeumannomyces tritici R3-111a-1]